MERNELKGKQTPGPIAVFNSTDIFTNTDPTGKGDVQICDCDVQRVVFETDKEIPARQCRANAALYAEAHNVANETGMWPLDMLERIKELENQLRLVIASNDDYVKCHEVKWINGTPDLEWSRDISNNARAILNKNK